MKTILCFGDSNTWGYDPVLSAGAPSSVRHGWETRWTGVLQRALGERVRVLEEGLNGRTTVHTDPLEEGRNGRDYLLPCLHSHKPLDAVVLMLGTNDLKARFGLPAGDVAEGAAHLVQLIQHSGCGPALRSPAVLLVCPPRVPDLGHLPQMEDKFRGAPEKSSLFPPLYEAWAERLGCAFLNSQSVVQTSSLDGLHLDSTEHQKLGEAIAAALAKMF
jgi:lysophospholipase L1-like esterase